MTDSVVGLVAMWLACGFNIGFTVWSYRQRKRERVALDALKQAYEESLKSLLPAVAFVIAVRDDDNVPDVVRRAAAAALPSNITVTRSTSSKVH
jgi:hypothetical protein